MGTEYRPVIATRAITASGLVIAPGDRILAASWGGVVYVLWNGAEIPIDPRSVRPVQSVIVAAENRPSAREEEYNEVKP